MAGLLFVAAVGASRSTRAEVPYRLSYSAPGECPTDEAFGALVSERTARGRVAEGADLARTMRVALVADGRKYRGTLRYRRGDGEIVRELRSDDCTELADAMALVVALAIDARGLSDNPVDVPEGYPLELPGWRAIRPPPVPFLPEWGPSELASPVTSPGPTVGAGVVGGGHSGYAPSTRSISGASRGRVFNCSGDSCWE